jgi:predicted RNase H-like nuclease (RuvC/YqgF family)
MTSYDGQLAVERSRWTDDRLDDLAERVMRQDVLEARFESLERRVEDFQQEMREFRAKMRDFRREITAEVQSLRSELNATKR